MDNKIAYHHYLKNQNLPIFFQDWWLDATAGPENWEVLLNFDKNEAITSIWAFSISKRWGNKIITNPILTPFLGVWLNYPKDISAAKKIDFEESELEKLISKLPKVAFIQCGFEVKFTNWQPFYWAGFEQTTIYTYIFEKGFSLEEVWENMNPKVRTLINKGKKELHIEVSNDVELMYQLLEDTFKKQNQKFPMTLLQLKNLYNAIISNKSGKMFIAKGSDNQLYGMELIIFDEYSVYNLLSVINLKFPHQSTSRALLWRGIQYAHENNLAYNFEGSMIKNVNQIYSSFGAKQVPYFLIRKSNNKWVETARIWLKKRL